MTDFEKYFQTQLEKSRIYLAKAEASLEMLEDAFHSMHFITDKNIDFVREIDNLKFKIEYINTKIEEYYN